jgi:hypothetical protein
MKFVTFIALHLFAFASFGQDHNYNKGCNVVKFASKKHTDSMILNPNYHPKGFYLVTNQVYDLVVDGKSYYYSLILKIEADRFIVATKWESADSGDKIIDTLTILTSQKIQVRMLTINNGRAGLPFKTKNEDFIVSIIPAENYCFAKYVPFETPKSKYITHQYFTQYPNKHIRIQKGRAYFIDERGEFPLAKK